MSQRDVPDYFAFYPYEFLSDERVLAMTLEQVGAYLLLIISQWINGSIPGDIPTLARLLKRTTAEMEILWTGVGPCFDPHPEMEGRMIQRRVEAERAAAMGAMSRSAKRQAAYRERKRAVEAARVLALQGRDGNATEQKRDVTKPSTLIYTSISTEEKTKRRDANTEKWGEFQRLYPAHRMDMEPAARAWVSRDDEADAILAGLKRWVNSEDWMRDSGKFVPKASKFIFDGAYKDAASAPAPAPPKPFDIRSITG